MKFDDLYHKELYNNNYLFKINNDELCIVPVNGKTYKLYNKDNKVINKKYKLLGLYDNNGVFRQINYAKFILVNFIPKNIYSTNKFEYIDGDWTNCKVSNLRWVEYKFKEPTNITNNKESKDKPKTDCPIERMRNEIYTALLKQLDLQDEEVRKVNIEIFTDKSILKLGMEFMQIINPILNKRNKE